MRISLPVAFTTWLLLTVMQIPTAGAAETRGDLYATEIKPLLRKRCFACHGAIRQEAGLRLDTIRSMLKGGESGPAVVPRMPRISLIVSRVADADPDARMPPVGEGEPLDERELTVIRTWIEQGGSTAAVDDPEPAADQHWAFQPLQRPRIPIADPTAGQQHPVDALLSIGQRAHQLQPLPDAPRIVLMRRLYLDLIGVPPADDEIAEFEQDQRPGWYQRTVDRLLDDPRHGERWGRHWMDVWRYSDWWGLGAQLRNSQKHIWHWRDWIVESLNEDLPYDEMVRLMLAADELHPGDVERLRATGYLARNYFLFNRPHWMEETVEHVSKGFLGLTMNCARCHDHKYDPIDQTDFYRMRAFFEPYHVRLDMLPGETDFERDGLPRIFDGLLDEPTYRYIRGDEKNPDQSVVIQPGVPTFLEFKTLRIEPVELPPEAWMPERQPWVIDAFIADAAEGVSSAKRDLDAAQKRLHDAERAVEHAQSQHELAEQKLALAESRLDSVQKRASACRAKWNQRPADECDRLRIAAIRSERDVALLEARVTLADAVVRRSTAPADKQTDLDKQLETARATVEKLAQTIDAPVAQEDLFQPFEGARWTATRFFNSGKDDPRVPFPERSSGRRSALADWITDPRNPLTARVAVNHIWMRHMGEPLVPTVFDFGRRAPRPANPELLDWLASEFIESGWSMKALHRLIVTSAAYRRSSSLAESGLNAERDPENRYWWRRVPVRLESQVIRDSILALSGTLDTTIGGPPIPLSEQQSSKRRSLYFFHSNNERNTFLTMFDEALVKDCYRRQQSIVPQQALALTNSRLVLDASAELARRLTDRRADETQFVVQAFKLILGIQASEAEIASSREALAAWRGLPDGSDRSARQHLVWVLFNHNDFVTLR